MLVAEELTREIIGAADVHRWLGPALLESAYCECLCHEFNLRHLSFAREVHVPVSYKAVQLDCAYRLDIVVAEQVIVEVKTVEQLLPVHEAQLLTYLKLTGLRVGLLLNFNVPTMKEGIRRLVL